METNHELIATVVKKVLSEMIADKIVRDQGPSGIFESVDEAVAQPVLDALAEMERLAAWIKPLLRKKPKGPYWMSDLESRLEQALLREGGSIPHEFTAVFSGAFIIASAED